MTIYRLQQLTVDIHPPQPIVGSIEIPIREELMQKMVEVLGPIYHGKASSNRTTQAHSEEEWKRLTNSALKDFEGYWKESRGETWQLNSKILTATTTYGDQWQEAWPSVLIRINGIRVEEEKSMGDLANFIKMAETAIEKDGRLALIPGEEAKEQLKVLKDFSNGKMSYSQMRSMIG
jgi:hypothetical protein